MVMEDVVPKDYQMNALAVDIVSWLEYVAQIEVANVGMFCMHPVRTLQYANPHGKLQPSDSKLQTPKSNQGHSNIDDIQSHFFEGIAEVCSIKYLADLATKCCHSLIIFDPFFGWFLPQEILQNYVLQENKRCPWAWAGYRATRR